MSSAPFGYPSPVAGYQAGYPSGFPATGGMSYPGMSYPGMSAMSMAGFGMQPMPGMSPAATPALGSAAPFGAQYGPGGPGGVERQVIPEYIQVPVSQTVMVPQTTYQQRYVHVPVQQTVPVPRVVSLIASSLSKFSILMMYMTDFRASCADCAGS